MQLVPTVILVGLASLSPALKVAQLINEDKIMEVDSMLCDVIEYAKIEREELMLKGEARGEARGKAIGEAVGELKKAIGIAKYMLMENLPMSIITKTTQLSEEQVRELAMP